MKTLSILFLSVQIIFAQNYSDYVDPFIGTGGHGHTFPGATTPFGMVQLSPDTDTQGWDWCSGYHYTDNSVMGFSHTHLSGTGAADYGDILLMPVTGELKWQPGAKDNPDEGYRSRFSHDKEQASPGYYQVFLDDYKINVELTATPRTGFHKYTFPKSSNAAILVDLKHGIADRVRESWLEVVSDHEIQGLRRSQGWANDQYVYFYIRFSKPFKSYQSLADKKETSAKKIDGKDVKTYFLFDTSKDEVIYVQVGISAIDCEGAKKNLTAELANRDFEQTVQNAKDDWNNWLAKIKVEGGSDDEKTVFYSALYHSLIAPNLYMDVDGRYRGRDLQIHRADGFNYYTLFSLWDTFRATHPLFTLIAPQYNRDFIRTMILQAEQGEDLPIWELSANETGTMIGYHSVPVIVDAFMKGQDDFDAEKALKAMKYTSTRDYRGLTDYQKLSYIPADNEINSVSKCVEYAFDDWCIAQMANKMGKQDDYKVYIRRSQNYLNQFDPETKFMRGRLSSGLWRTPFDPRNVSHLGSSDFTEGNSWQYTFFVPHNVNHLIELMGGDQAFNEKLDNLFNESELFGLERSPDVSGLIGNYAHGNEPSHHIAYLYNYSGQSWKTQEMVKRIKTEMYKTGPEGLPGNEDCGQMSAWYVFSSLGFYPVAPGQNQYVIGTPGFDKITVTTAPGKSFTITSNKSQDNGYFVDKVTLNGNEYKQNYIKHSDLAKGANIDFKLTAAPNKSWGNAAGERVKSIPVEEQYKIERVEKSHAMMPYFNDEATVFSGSKTIELSSITPGAKIYYTTDGTDPDENSELYKKPFQIDKSCTVKARAFKKGFEPSFIYQNSYKRVDFANSKIDLSLKNEPDNRYDKGGKYALLDNRLGSLNHGDGKWLGFEGVDLDATLHFDRETDVAKVKIRFLREQGAWIFLPQYVECFSSEDGKNFKPVAKTDLPIPTDFEDDVIKEVELPVNLSGTQYLKIFVKSLEKNPAWHGSPGGKNWLFVDEIILSSN